MRTRTLALLLTLPMLLLVGAVSTGATHAPRTHEPEPGSDRWWEQVAERFAGDAGATADTRPARDVTMSFTFPIQVGEMLVEGGQRVGSGDVLVRARDAEFVASLELQRVRAASELGITEATDGLELAQFRWDQIQESISRGSRPSPLEEAEARIGLAQAKTRLEQAKEVKLIEEVRLRQQEGQYERYRLEAPFDATVEEIYVDLGQTMNETEPVLRLVDTARLLLDPNPPTALVRSLDLGAGDPAWIMLRLADQPVVVQGRIAYISPVGDPVTRTVRVRVELDNTGAWPAGTPAVVRFTEPDQAEASARGLDADARAERMPAR